MSSPRLKSHIWQHFTKSDSDKKVTCLYCSTVLSVANKSTCSLIRHLRKKHVNVQFSGQSSTETTVPEDFFVFAKSDDTDLKLASSTETVEEFEIETLVTPEDPEEKKPDQKPAPRAIRLKSSQNVKQPAEQHVISSITEAKRHIEEALVSMKSLTAKKQIEELDEYDHFAHMIAAKIRKIQDMDERETVMNSIHNIVYKALMKNI